MEECQNLQRFHWKIAKILPAVNGNIAVLKAFKQCWEEGFDRLKVQPSLTDIGDRLEQLEFQKESIRSLGDQARRSTDMVILTHFARPRASVAARILLTDRHPLW